MATPSIDDMISKAQDAFNEAAHRHCVALTTNPRTVDRYALAQEQELTKLLMVSAWRNRRTAKALITGASSRRGPKLLWDVDEGSWVYIHGVDAPMRVGVKHADGAAICETLGGEERLLHKVSIVYPAEIPPALRKCRGCGGSPCCYTTGTDYWCAKCWDPINGVPVEFCDGCETPLTDDNGCADDHPDTCDACWELRPDDDETNNTTSEVRS